MDNEVFGIIVIILLDNLIILILLIRFNHKKIKKETFKWFIYVLSSVIYSSVTGFQPHLEKLSNIKYSYDFILYYSILRVNFLVVKADRERNSVTIFCNTFH